MQAAYLSTAHPLLFFFLSSSTTHSFVKRIVHLVSSLFFLGAGLLALDPHSLDLAVHSSTFLNLDVAYARFGNISHTLGD